MTDEKLIEAEHLRDELSAIRHRLLNLHKLSELALSKNFFEVQSMGYRVEIPQELKGAIVDMLLGFYDRKDQQLTRKYEEM